MRRYCKYYDMMYNKKYGNKLSGNKSSYSGTVICYCDLI